MDCFHSPAPSNDQTSWALPGPKAHVSTFPAVCVPQSTSADLTADSPSSARQADRLVPKCRCRIYHRWRRGWERSQVSESSRGLPRAMLSPAHDSPGSNEGERSILNSKPAQQWRVSSSPAFHVTNPPNSWKGISVQGLRSVRSPEPCQILAANSASEEN